MQFSNCELSSGKETMSLEEELKEGAEHAHRVVKKESV